MNTMTRRNLLAIAAGGLTGAVTGERCARALVEPEEFDPARIFNGFVGHLWEVRFVSHRQILAADRIESLLADLMQHFMESARLVDPERRLVWTVWHSEDPMRRGMFIGLAWSSPYPRRNFVIKKVENGYA